MDDDVEVSSLTDSISVACYFTHNKNNEFKYKAWIKFSKNASKNQNQIICQCENCVKLVSMMQFYCKCTQRLFAYAKENNLLDISMSEFQEKVISKCYHVPKCYENDLNSMKLKLPSEPELQNITIDFEPQKNPPKYLLTRKQKQRIPSLGEGNGKKIGTKKKKN